MNLKEHYEDIIEKIEKKAKKSYGEKAGNIAEDICKEEFINIREFNAIFKFMTGYSLIDYIKERQMMIAYKTLIDNEEFDSQSAIEISGLDNQNSFGKKFKETFGLTPTEAHSKHNESLYKDPLKWEQLISNEHPKSRPVKESEDKIFGIVRPQYEKIVEVLDYKSLYGFDDLQSEVAFEVSEKYNISIKDAFTLVYDYSEYCRLIDNKVPDEKKLKFLINPRSSQMRRLYFEATGSVFGAFELIEEAEESGINIKKIGSEYLEIYYENHYDDCNLEELLEQIKKFEALGGKDFEEYMELVYNLGFSEEDAARGIPAELEDCDFEEDAWSEFQNETIEQWVKDNDDYNNSEKMMIDYDEDNPYYDDSDTDILE